MANKNFFLVLSIGSPTFWKHHSCFPLRGRHSPSPSPSGLGGVDLSPKPEGWACDSSLASQRQGDWSDMWSSVANENQPWDQGFRY